MSNATSDAPWTTRRLLDWMSTYLEKQEVESARLLSEMLMCHILRCERMRLYMEPERIAADDERQRLRSLVKRAADHEPVQYIVGEAWFFGKPFEVSPSTLIPRPATESLIEQAMKAMRATQANTDEMHSDTGAVAGIEDQPIDDIAPDILDLCTGTGCIAITLASLIPDASVVATDVEPNALQLAAANADRHGVGDRISFAAGDLFAALQATHEDACFDLICANPPYVSDNEWDDLAANVKEHEPASALRAGADGMEFIRPLLYQAPRFLKPGGYLFVEIGHHQRDLVEAHANAVEALCDVQITKDLEGFWRVLSAKKS